MKNGKVNSGDILTEENIDEFLSNLVKNITDKELEEINKRRASGETGFLSDSKIEELLTLA